MYIAFLAWDEFVATHNQDGLAGAPQVPGEKDPEGDSEKLTGIAFKIKGDLVKEANASIDEDEDSSIKTSLMEFTREL